MHESGKIEEYCAEMSSGEPEALHRIWRRSNLHLVGGRMCSGHLQGRLLAMLAELTGARRIVELGTFSGYATVCLGESLPPDGKLVTIERDEELADFISQSLSEAGVSDRVEVRFGDGLQRLSEIESRSIDLLFMDADKRQYPEYYREARRIVKGGGLIIADNTLWDGHVIDSRYDGDPQTEGIRQFNRLVREDAGVEKVLLPLRDGLTLIYVAREQNRDESGCVRKGG